MSLPPELVILDCDGVLVDSEPIAVAIDLQLLGRVGLTLSRQEVIDRFVGRSAGVMTATIEAHLGAPIGAELAREFDGLYAAAMERDLEPVPGVVEALARVELPVCVASGSYPDSLRRKLTRVGLQERFAGRVFSAAQVAHGKPAPDLFLHAARTLGVVPERCVVVEDSRPGVEAARAAGMHVFAYAGGFVDPATLHGPGTTLFSDMGRLPELLAAHDCTV